MESDWLVPSLCSEHGLPLDVRWQCPDSGCRKAFCPGCGASEFQRCVHLLYTDGEWVYYVADGVSSEDFPSADFEQFELEELVDAFDGDEQLAQELSQLGDPLRTLCGLVWEQIEGPKLMSLAGGSAPGSDGWTNAWVRDPAEALLKFAPILMRYHAGIARLNEREEGIDTE